jgi:hypothetical protein
MGKGLNRERRRAQAARDNAPFHHEPVVRANPPANLRMVRPAKPDVPVEPVAPGRSSEAIDPVREPQRSHGDGGTKEDDGLLVSAADTGSDETTVTRSFDAADINAVFNDPSVFPLISIPGIETIDAAPLVADQRNVLLMAQGGGILFCWQEPGIYEVHTAFLEAHRGKHAIRSSLAAYRWMFTHTDCMTLLTRVPAFNTAAAGMCKIVGATKEFERKGVWPTPDGKVDMSFWSLRYDDWVRKTPSLMKSGDRFHKRLVEEKLRLGKTEPLHADDECHDLHVGACAETMYGGKLEKAVILYNRWARFAGYGLISLVAHEPPIIDIGDAVLQITGDTFKALVCR